jgi:hypothetical protein
VPLGFSPLRKGDPVEEFSAALPLLDSEGAKILKLEEAIGRQLEAEGRALVKAVAEYVLASFWSQDPQISLEMTESTRAGVEDTAKLVAERFEHQLEDV